MRNLGDQVLTDIALIIAFFDKDRRPVGDEVQSVQKVEILPGEQQDVTISHVCPPAAESAKARVPDRSEQPDFKASYELISSLPSVQYLDPKGSTFISVQVPDIRACPYPEPCELRVNIKGGGESHFNFRREAPSSPLINANPILIAHLDTSGDATIHFDSSAEQGPVIISEENLVRRSQTPASLWERLRSVFSLGLEN